MFFIPKCNISEFYIQDIPILIPPSKYLKKYERYRKRFKKKL